MPSKAIEASIESRKIKNGDTEHSCRRDVVHKALFRAMKRYYSCKFEEAYGSQTITKDDFKRLVKVFIDATVISCSDSFKSIEDLSQNCRNNVGVSQQGMITVMMTLISHRVAKACLKNKWFNKHFVNGLYKYSEYVFTKIFSDKNFWVIAHHFLTEAFDEVKHSIPTYMGMTTF